MIDPTFPVLGTDIPKMYGRKEIMTRISNDLTKRSPSHLTIIGPRYSGKSVVMHEILKLMKTDSSPYDVVILLDLGHQTPQDDQSFLLKLCQSIGDALKECSEEYAEHLLSIEDDFYNELIEVIDALKDEEINILMLWDGFDKVLSKGRITRNLWDQLRELASNSNFRLVTATRKRLQELIRSEESATSDFWGIFDMTPVKISSFTEQDTDEIYKKIPNLNLSNGAKSEIENFTALYPPLFLGVLNQLININSDTEITNQQVTTLAENLPDIFPSILTELWKDCSESSRQLYSHLVDHGEISITKVSATDEKELFEKGFIKKSGNKIVKHCRFLEKYIATLPDDIGSLTRLFKDVDEYNINIRSVLELRLNQLVGIDKRLKRKIKLSIDDIPDYPEDCIENVRGIIDRSLDLIWNAEFGDKKEIPSEWLSSWKTRGETSMSKWNNQFPYKRGHQVGLLQLMTGTANTSAKAKYVSKNTYALANALQGFGDFGQHLDGATVPVGIAIASINLSLELASLLVEELK